MDVKLFLNKIKELATWAVELDTVDAEAPQEEAVETAPVDEVVEEEVVEAAPEVEAVVEEPADEVVLEEEAATPDYVTRGELEEALNGLKSLFSKHVEKLEAEKVELQKQIDDKPDAEIIKHTPKVELKKATASTKKGRITQFLNNK
jgi:hypothetical protein